MLEAESSTEGPIHINCSESLALMAFKAHLEVNIEKFLLKQQLLKLLSMCFGCGVTKTSGSYYN